MKSVKRLIVMLLFALSMTFVFVYCTHDDVVDELKIKELTDQVRVQVAYDASHVVFKFVWKSQNKKLPVGFPNVGFKYPMQVHDPLRHNGTSFDRLPSGQRLDEDRISFMIDKYEGGVTNFGKMGCAVSCHTGMASHRLLTSEVLDHWHWRGGRSGPIGYAEDAAVDAVERIRDGLGTPPTNFIRSAGDRFREDQAAYGSGLTGHPVLVDRFPRFVFNKGKNVGGFTVPRYFLADESGNVITNPYTEIPQMKDTRYNRSLLVVYQDLGFDPVDKVNAIDLSYLLYVALGTTDHLPAHLSDPMSASFLNWKNYWAAELGIGETQVVAAVAKLDDIHLEWMNSGKTAMIGRSLAFIYNSDQHDITSTKSYDPVRNEWTVIMKRKLNTGSINDANLVGLQSGEKYTISFAMHDQGGSFATHDISLPYILSSGAGADITAKSVVSVNNVNWNAVPFFDTHWVRREVISERFRYDWLTGPSHPGAGMVFINNCGSCHNSANRPLLNSNVIH